MRETRTPHGRLIDLIHSTRVPHHESREKGVPTLQWAEAVDHPVTHGIAQSEDRRARPGHDPESGDIHCAPMGAAPDLPWAADDSSLDPYDIAAGRVRARRKIGEDRTRTQVEAGEEPIPTVVDVAGHDRLCLDASRGQRVEGGSHDRGVDGGERHDQSRQEPTPRRHPENGDGRQDETPARQESSPSSHYHPHRASNPGSGDGRGKAGWSEIRARISSPSSRPTWPHRCLAPPGGPPPCRTAHWLPGGPRFARPAQVRRREGPPTTDASAWLRAIKPSAASPPPVAVNDSPGPGIFRWSPSTSGRARLTSSSNAPSRAPPAAAIASATIAPSTISTTPGVATHPETYTGKTATPADAASDVEAADSTGVGPPDDAEPGPDEDGGSYQAQRHPLCPTHTDPTKLSYGLIPSTGR